MEEQENFDYIVNIFLQYKDRTPLLDKKKKYLKRLNKGFKVLIAIAVVSLGIGIYFEEIGFTLLSLLAYVILIILPYSIERQDASDYVKQKSSLVKIKVINKSSLKEGEIDHCYLIELYFWNITRSFNIYKNKTEVLLFIEENMVKLDMLELKYELIDEG